MSFNALVLLSVLFSWSAAAVEPPPVEQAVVVINVDGTLVRRVPKGLVERLGIPANRLIEADGQSFRLADGAEQVLAQLQKSPNTKLVFASNRTDQVKALLDGIESKTGVKLYSGGAPEVVRSGSGELVDLSTFGPNLSNVVVLTHVDSPSHIQVPEGQKANVVELGRDYFVFENWAAVEAARPAAPEAEKKFYPETEEKWRLHQARVKAVLSPLTQALDGFNRRRA